MKIKLLIILMALGLGASAQYTNVGANGVQRQIVSGDSTFRWNLGSAGFLYGKSLSWYRNNFAPIIGSGNYIQNQNSSAQTANAWINGQLKIGTTTFDDGIGGFFQMQSEMFRLRGLTNIIADFEPSYNIFYGAVIANNNTSGIYNYFQSQDTSNGNAGTLYDDGLGIKKDLGVGGTPEGILKADDITANRTWQLPDDDGDVALTNQIPLFGTTVDSVGGLQSYTGVIKNVYEGDSMTDVATGFATNYPVVLRNKDELFRTTTSYNVATSGDKVIEYINNGQYASQVYQHRPKNSKDITNLYFMMGTNDLGVGLRTALMVYNDLKTVWAQAKGDRFNVIAFTLPPRDDIYNVKVDSLNTYIRSDTSLYNKLVDVGKAFIGVNPASPEFFYDGLHPNLKGSSAIALTVLNSVNRTGFVDNIDAKSRTSGRVDFTGAFNGAYMDGVGDALRIMSSNYIDFINLLTGTPSITFNTRTGETFQNGTANISGKATVALPPVNPNDVLRLTDLGTGWATYADNVYTTGSPLTVNSGVTVTLPNNAATVINSQIPLGVTSFYNSGTTKITPELSGDSYLINVRFKARSSNASGLAKVGIDIGSGTVTAEETQSLRNGIATEQIVNLVFDVYSGATFVANGGLVKFTSVIGNTEIYDILYKITRVHKAK